MEFKQLRFKIRQLTVFIPIFFLFTAAIGLPAEGKNKLLSLTDTFKAPILRMDNSNFYVYDNAFLCVVIYSRKDGKRITRFGRRGEGPGEFRTNPSITLSHDFIWVSNFPKLSQFTKKGEFIKDMRNPDSIDKLIPFGEKFVGVNFVNIPGKKNDQAEFTIWDPNLERKKDLVKVEFQKFVVFGSGRTESNWVRDCTKMMVYRDRLLIGASGHGYFFRVFGINGNKRYDINKIYRKRPINDDYKKMRLAQAEKAMGKERFAQLQRRFKIIFPSHFPAYINFSVADGRIYVFKYPETVQELEILDLKGNRLGLKTISIPDAPGCIESDGFSISDGILYYMAENPDSEDWEICSINID